MTFCDNMKTVLMYALKATGFVVLMSLPSLAMANSVLVLLSGHKELPWAQSVEAGIDAQMAEYRSRGVADMDVYVEYLNLFKRPPVEHDQRLSEIEKKYARKAIDLILTEGVAGARLVQKAVDFYPKESRYDRPVFINFNTAGVGRENSFDIQPGYETLLRLVHRVMPSLRGVIVAGTLKASERDEIQQAVMSVLGRKPEMWDSGFSRAEIINRTESLSRRDVIILQPRLRDDNSGQRYVPYKVANALSAVSEAPVFTRYESLLGSGIAGGYLLSGLEVGKAIVKTAHTPTLNWAQTSFNICGFDKQALDHWNIDISFLPKGVKLINDPDDTLSPGFIDVLLSPFRASDNIVDELDTLCLWHQQGR
jgi:hypothetical protein